MKETSTKWVLIVNPISQILNFMHFHLPLKLPGHEQADQNIDVRR